MNEGAIIRALKTPSNLIASGYEKLTVTGAVAQALTVPTTATYAEIGVESAVTGVCARFLMLGATLAPTTANGLAMSAGLAFDITNGDNLVNFLVIATSGTTVLHVQYYK